MIVAVVGARERRHDQNDRRTIEELLAKSFYDHGPRLLVVTYGCDIGIGNLVSDICERLGIKWMEYRAKFHNEGFTPEEINKLYGGRNSAVLEVSDEFHLFTGPRHDGLVEQLEQPAREKVKDSRVFTYPERRA